MGFIFRTVFWLGLALVALPPEARLGGGDDMTTFRDLNVAAEVNAVAETVRTQIGNLMSTCETNPQLCKAGADLVNNSLAAATDMAEGMAVQLASEPHKPLATAESAKPRSQKIQARVE